MNAHAAPTTGTIIAVASGKGGVGKTWFAITLAHALARRDRRVLLVDADLGLANIDVQLGVLPPHDIGAVAEGALGLGEAVFHHDGGFDILSGRSGSGALSTLDPLCLGKLIATMRAATLHYDSIVLDLGAGVDGVVRRLSGSADRLALVVTDEPTSLTDGYAVLKLFLADGGSLDTAHVVVNQSASRGAGERTFATLARACALFLKQSPRLAGVVRRDERVRDAIRRQTPLLTRHPASAAAVDVEAIAADLSDR